MINIDITGIPALSPELLSEAASAWESVKRGDGTHKDWNGWVTLPDTFSDEDIAKIRLTAEKIRAESKMVVVLGIGGSYLGARAAIDFIKSDKYNLAAVNSPRIFFAGNNMSAAYTQQIMSFAATQSLSLIVVSKSGKTLEISVAFRVFYNLMKAKYGEKACERIYVITDPQKGALREFADKHGCISFSLPSNIGGRYFWKRRMTIPPVTRKTVASFPKIFDLKTFDFSLYSLIPPTIRRASFAKIRARILFPLRDISATSHNSAKGSSIFAEVLRRAEK